MTSGWNEDDRITRALEQAPAVTVPADFADRVMAQLPEQKVARVPAGLQVHRDALRTQCDAGRRGPAVLPVAGGGDRVEGRCGVVAGGVDGAGTACGDYAVVRAGVADAQVPCSQPSVPVRLFPFGLPIEQQSIEMLDFVVWGMWDMPACVREEGACLSIAHIRMAASGWMSWTRV